MHDGVYVRRNLDTSVDARRDVDAVDGEVHAFDYTHFGAVHDHFGAVRQIQDVFKFNDDVVSIAVAAAIAITTAATTVVAAITAAILKARPLQKPSAFYPLTNYQSSSESYPLYRVPPIYLANAYAVPYRKL